MFEQILNAPNAVSEPVVVVARVWVEFLIVAGFLAVSACALIVSLLVFRWAMQLAREERQFVLDWMSRYDDDDFLPPGGPGLN